MSGEVKSAKEATEIAQSFVQQYFFFARPRKAIRDDGIWLVELDVGALTPMIAKVKLDAKSGDVLEYTIH